MVGVIGVSTISISFSEVYFMLDNRPIVRVVDAVMGTGKSTWIMLNVQRTGQRTIVVVPRKTEVSRYQDGLENLGGVVALTDSDEDKRSKKERFVDALSDAQVIITTHQLFEDHLTIDTFELIKEGEWSLVLDEVPTVFEPVKLVSGTVIDGYVSQDVVQEVELNDKVSKLTVNPRTYESYRNLPTSEASLSEKRMLKEATIKDVLIVKKEDYTRGFPTFSLREERLNAFENITILTYPFKGSDLDYWLQIKGYYVAHLELTRNSSTGSFEDFYLGPHSGEYSGSQFKDLIEFVEGKSRGRRESYGDKPNHFSATDMRGMISKKSEPLKRAAKLNDPKKTIRREFRNRADKSRWADSGEFMFTCLSEAKDLWKDRQRDLTGDFIGDANHVSFNTIGTNDYSHKLTSPSCTTFSSFLR
jgi:hypothetical protein